MSTMLDEIVKTKKQEIQNLYFPKEPSPVSFTSLYEAIQYRKTEVAIIAEVKKASPSKGVIRESFNPIEIAKGYERGGATAISVLTDETYFQGHHSYLTNIKQNIKLPVLRKDFIITEHQIKQSSLLGADAILLIAAILTPNQLHEYYELAHETGLDVLIEVHDEIELDSTLNKFTPKLLGINNRDLKTFKTSLEITKELARFIPNETMLVSESGIFTKDELLLIKDFGADAVLVGEALMRSETPEIGVQTLLGEK